MCVSRIEINNEGTYNVETAKYSEITFVIENAENM